MSDYNSGFWMGVVCGTIIVLVGVLTVMSIILINNILITKSSANEACAKLTGNESATVVSFNDLNDAQKEDLNNNQNDLFCKIPTQNKNSYDSTKHIFIIGGNN